MLDVLNWKLGSSIVKEVGYFTHLLILNLLGL